MRKGRLEAFSDGVIAIIITIMVLELRPPDGAGFDALGGLWPKFVAYLLSFVIVGVYWNNHHHLLQAAERVDGLVLWANLHLLLWLSIIPFGTAWLGEHNDSPAPVTVYGVIQLGCAVAYFGLTASLLRLHAPTSPLALALGRDVKGKLSALAYVAGIPLGLVSPRLAFGLYALVALVWLVPDRRISLLVGAD